MAQRKRNIYDPASTEPFKLSRSKIDSFTKCARCFYLDRRLGVGQVQCPGYTLNSAVDQLLKNEFDELRRKGKAHPLMIKYGVDAVPIGHPDLNEWRENFKGIRYHDEETNFIITGAIDDLWQGSDGKYIVVDYKATSKASKIDMDDGSPWYDQYHRQMEIYQWLLRRNGLDVSNTGYFLYVNGKKDLPAFGNKLEFTSVIIPYEGDDSWVDDAIKEAHLCLQSDSIPKANDDCEWCAYRSAALAHEHP